MAILRHLEEMSKDIFKIREDLPSRLPKGIDITASDDYTLDSFEQGFWNTDGFFEDCKKGAFVTKIVYVIAPFWEDGLCFVYFGSKFGYSCPYSIKFEDDVVNKRQVRYVSTYKKYYCTPRNTYI